MEIVLLLVAVVGWLVVRSADRSEVRDRLKGQDDEIGRLRSEIAVLQRQAASATAPVPVKPEEAEVVRPAAYTHPSPAHAMADLRAHAIRPEPVVSVPPPPPVIPFVPTPAPAKPSLEQTLGTNWLNRLGITLLVFGLAFFLAYQVTHLGPVGKVLLSYAVSLTLLGGGLWLERKEQYRVFARAGIGGGWSLTFLTTYAMYFFPATQVLASQAVDLVLLFAVGVGMVAHSLRYRSQVVTGLAFLLAFSTVTISQVSAFSLLASAVLALGLEYVCVKEEWYGLEIAGIIAAYGNHFLWLDKLLDQYGGPGHPFPLWGESTALLLLFWAIFRAGYCIRKPSDETAEGMSGLVAILNSIGILTLMKYQSFHPEYAFRALLALGTVEMVLAFAMRPRRRPAFAVLVTIASVLLVAAIPFRLHGSTWSVVWVLEGEALFVCGLVLRERLMRWLGVLTHLLVVGQMLVMHGDILYGTRPTDWPIVATTYFLVAIAMWINAEGLSRREEKPDIPYHAVLILSSIAAALCAVLGLWLLVPVWPLVLVWSLLALVLLEVGLRTRSIVLRLEAYGMLAIAILRLATVNLTANGRAGIDDIRLWAGAGVIAACLLLNERLNRSREVASTGEIAWASGVAMWCASALVSSLLYLELQPQWLAAGWAAFALILAAAALVRDTARLRSKALLLALMATGRALVFNLGEGTDGVFTNGSWSTHWGRPAYFTAIAILCAAVPIGFLLRRNVLPETPRFIRWDGWLRRPEQTFFFCALTLLAFWIPVDFHHANLTMGWSALGVATFLVALAAGERSFRLAGLGLLLLGVAKLLLVDVWGLPPTERYLLLIGVGIALLLVSFLYSRFGERLKEYL